MKKKSRFVVILSLALILPATMMMLLAMSGVVRKVAQPRPEGPCDIYTAGQSMSLLPIAAHVLCTHLITDHSTRLCVSLTVKPSTLE